MGEEGERLGSLSAWRERKGGEVNSHTLAITPDDLVKVIDFLQVGTQRLRKKEKRKSQSQDSNRSVAKVCSENTGRN